MTRLNARSLALATALAAALPGCPDSAGHPDSSPDPSLTFYSPQAIAATQHSIIVANTGFHYEGDRTAYEPGFVTVIDRGSRRVVGRIPSTQLNPQAIAVHQHRAYVVNSGRISQDKGGTARVDTDGGIDVIDLSTEGGPQLVTNIVLGRGSEDPRIGAFGSIALDPGGGIAYLGSGTRGDLFKVDLAGARILRGVDHPIVIFPTAAEENGMTVVRPHAAGVAVLNFNGDELCLSTDFVGALDQRSCGSVGVQAQLLEGPIDLAEVPDGRALVLMTIANSLYRVDTSKQPFSVEHAFAKTGLANNRVLVHGNYAYVLNSMSNNLQRVDLATGNTELPFAVLPVGSRPYDMVITTESEGAVAWITLQGFHQLALVSLESGQTIATLPVDTTTDGGDATADGGTGTEPDADAPGDLRPCPEAGLPPVVGIESVVQASYGPGAGDGQDKLPGVIQGGPSGGGASGGNTDDVLSLGVGGEIVVDFGAYDVVDGPGPDLVVFENPFLVSAYVPYAEPARVAVSASEPSPQSFVEFPCDLSLTQGDPVAKVWPYPGCAGVKPVLASPEQCVPASDPQLAGGDAFDLADLGLTQARYLRVRDAGVSQLGNTSKGFDLDAVVLINYKKR
jgi:hypothetical protein